MTSSLNQDAEINLIIQKRLYDVLEDWQSDGMIKNFSELSVLREYQTGFWHIETGLDTDREDMALQLRLRRSILVFAESLAQELQIPILEVEPQTSSYKMHIVLGVSNLVR